MVLSMLVTLTTSPSLPVLPLALANLLALDPDDLDGHALDGLRLAPGFQLLRRLFHVAVLFPVRIKMRRFVGQLNVVAELGDDRAVPQVVDETFGLIGIHSLIPM